MLKISGLSKNIKKRKILDNINLELDNGIYGFLGPNGAGKTTLIRCITGVYPTFDGTVILDDNYSLGSREYTNKIGYLPQSFGLFKDMRVCDVMLYMASLIIKDEKRAQEEVEYVLAKVNLSNRKKDKVKTLSGGMIRRLGVAQALLGNPRVLIFDEPTAGLDPEERVRFREIISKLDKDKIVIISTHIVSDVMDTCDKVIVLNEGKILMNDNIEALANKSSDTSKTGSALLEDGYICLLSEQ